MNILRMIVHTVCTMYDNSVVHVNTRRGHTQYSTNCNHVRQKYDKTNRGGIYIYIFPIALHLEGWQKSHSVKLKAVFTDG